MLWKISKLWKSIPEWGYFGGLQVRAIVEGQFVAMRAHAERIGLPCPPNRVIATGGGSTNKHLLALLASVFGCDVYTANCPGESLLEFYHTNLQLIVKSTFIFFRLIFIFWKKHPIRSVFGWEASLHNQSVVWDDHWVYNLHLISSCLS